MCNDLLIHQDGHFPLANHNLDGSGGRCTLACDFKVSKTITELVITSCDDASLLTIQGITDTNFGFAAIAVIKEVWVIHYLS